MELPPSPSPTTVQPARSRQQPAWPTIIGVLCMIYAILGIILHTCAGLSPFFQNAMFRMSGIGEVEMSSSIMLMQVIGGFMGFVLGIVLLIGSIHLLRRKKSGIRLILTWVVLRVLLAIVGLGFVFGTLQAQVAYQLQVQDAVQERMASNNAAYPTKTSEEIASSTKFWGLGGTSVVLIFPIVIGVLLTSKSRREYVASWEREAA